MHFNTYIFLYSFDSSNILLLNTKKYCIYHRTEAIFLRLKKKPIFIRATLASHIFHIRSEKVPSHSITCSRDGHLGGKVSRKKGGEGNGVLRRAALDAQHIKLHELQSTLGAGEHKEAQKYRSRS